MRATPPTARTTPITRPSGMPTASAAPKPSSSDWRLISVAAGSAPERAWARSAVSVTHGVGKLKLIGTRAAHSQSSRKPSTEPTRRARTTSALADVLQHGLERRRVEELLGTPLAHRARQIPGGHLERQVLDGARPLHPVEAAIEIEDLHERTQLALELGVVQLLQRLAPLAHPELRVTRALAIRFQDLPHELLDNLGLLLGERVVHDERARRHRLVGEVDQHVKLAGRPVVDDLGGREVERRGVDGPAQQRLGARRGALRDE